MARQQAEKAAGVQFVSLNDLRNSMKQKKLRPVLMAVATQGGGIINQHFGHAKEFLIYEVTQDSIKMVGHAKTDLYCSGNTSCGDGESVLQKLIRALEGCELVLCAKIGLDPWEQLEAAGITPNSEHAMEPIEEALRAVYQEMADNGALTAPRETHLLQAAG